MLISHTKYHEESSSIMLEFLIKIFKYKIKN